MQLVYYGGSLEHHGIKGQKWGRRRYQNADGSLTPAGLNRYGHTMNSNGTMKYNKTDTSVTKKVKNDFNKMSDKEFKKTYYTSKKTYAERVRKKGDPYATNKFKGNREAIIKREKYVDSEGNQRIKSTVVERKKASPSPKTISSGETACKNNSAIKTSSPAFNKNVSTGRKVAGSIMVAAGLGVMTVSAISMIKR